MSFAVTNQSYQVTRWPYNHCHSLGLKPAAWLDGLIKLEGGVLLKTNRTGMFRMEFLWFFAMHVVCKFYDVILGIEKVLLELVYF